MQHPVHETVRGRADDAERLAQKVSRRIFQEIQCGSINHADPAIACEHDKRVAHLREDRVQEFFGDGGLAQGRAHAIKAPGQSR